MLAQIFPQIDRPSRSLQSGHLQPPKSIVFNGETCFLLRVKRGKSSDQGEMEEGKKVMY